MGENSVKHVLWILCAVILAADNCFCFDFSVFAVLPSLQLNLFVNELVFSKTISLPSFSWHVFSSYNKICTKVHTDFMRIVLCYVLNV